ncbi:hypothetical protein P8631_22110, partial [Guyparkeria sp. 1SP6A2]|nr:hypothetical protein [Guyparkeria sp. 1SP6A2]
ARQAATYGQLQAAGQAAEQFQYGDEGSGKGDLVRAFVQVLGDVSCGAFDLASEGIDVTLVSPGFVDTPLTQKNDFPMPMR